MNRKKVFEVMSLDLKYLEEMEEDMFGKVLKKDIIQNALFPHLNQVKKVL